LEVLDVATGGGTDAAFAALSQAARGVAFAHPGYDPLGYTAR
jgi:hypothetical protein